jgi:hypothetical protein
VEVEVLFTPTVVVEEVLLEMMVMMGRMILEMVVLKLKVVQEGLMEVILEKMGVH